MEFTVLYWGLIGFGIALFSFVIAVAYSEIFKPEKIALTSSLLAVSVAAILAVGFSFHLGIITYIMAQGIIYFVLRIKGSNEKYNS